MMITNYILTPLLIEMLLHSHYSPKPFPSIRYPAQQKGVKILKQYNLISDSLTTPDVYVLTDRGLAHIHNMMCLPLPIKKEIKTVTTKFV